MKCRAIFAVVVLLVLAPAFDAMGQCVYTKTFTSMFITGYWTAGATFLTGSSLPNNCSLTYQNTTANQLSCFSFVTAPGGFNCPPTAMSGCRVLLAYVSSGATGPHTCNWTCSCGAGVETITLDNSDGLPVELMEFSVEEEGVSEQADQE